MNIFKFQLDIHCNDPDEKVGILLKKAYTADDNIDQVKYLDAKYEKKGDIFKSLFSSKSILGYDTIAAPKLEYFVILDDGIDKKKKITISIYVITTDQDLLKCTNAVISDLKSHCEHKKLDTEKLQVKEVYLYICNENDILYQDVSIIAKMGKESISKWDIVRYFVLVMIILISIILLFANDNFKWYEALGFALTAIIPFLTELPSLLTNDFRIRNITQSFVLGTPANNYLEDLTGKGGTQTDFPDGLTNPSTSLQIKAPKTAKKASNKEAK